MTFGNKVTLPDTARVDASSEYHIGPALAGYQGRVYLAWKGTDGRLNSEWSYDGAAFGGKVSYPEKTFEGSGPELGDFAGSLYMASRDPINGVVFHVKPIA